MIKKIWNIITTLIVIIVVILACILYVPKFFGITPMAVLSGSMEPTYHVGSVVFIEKIDPEEVEVGDAITFKIGAGDTVVTHRVISINEEEKTFATKGDANDNADGDGVAFSNLKGRAKDFSIPLLGYVAVYLGTTKGLILLGIAILMIILISFIIDQITKKDEGKHKE